MLVVLAVVVVMGAGVCYRTRVYRRQMHHLAGTPGAHGHITVRAASPPRDWGPKPNLFDVYLRPPNTNTNTNEKKMEADWEDVMVRYLNSLDNDISSSFLASPYLYCLVKPVSLTRSRGGLDPKSPPSLTRVSVMISMPSSQPFLGPDHLDLMPDDERHLPHVEFGLSDIDLLLPDADALRSSSDSSDGTKKKG